MEKTMSLESTSTGDNPNTYMEQFCQAVHPEFELGTLCVEWFRQAIKHCTELIGDPTPPTALIWTTVKNFIFPDRPTELVSEPIPIYIHPNRLSTHQCQSLFLNMLRDYVQRTPLYAAESSENVMLWQVMYCITGTMALAALAIGLMTAYNKYAPAKQMLSPLEEFFKPEKRMEANANRSLRRAKAELRNINIKPFARAHDLMDLLGGKFLVLKVGTKYDFLETLITRRLHSEGRFHLIMMFEEDVDFKDDLPSNERKNSTGLLPLKKMEGDNCRNPASACFNTSRQTKIVTPNTTPRLSGAGNSSIPRNVAQRAKKSK